MAFESQAILKPFVLRFRHARLPQMRHLPIALPKGRLTRTIVEPFSLNELLLS